jgi:hypothetical protein
MGILEHDWGTSAGADRIWSHVSGLRPSRADSRGLAVFQAYVDESEAEGGFFALGGLISTAERWASFSREWEAMLKHGTLSKTGEYHFKMAEMAISEERKQRVPWFFNVAAKHSISLFSCVIHKQHLSNAWGRIYVPGINIRSTEMRNIWTVAFRILMDSLYFGRNALGLPKGEKLHFIFDERSEKSVIMERWDEYIGGLPEAESLFGGPPRFENDREFLPLQAADLWAWWARTIKEAGASERPAFAKNPPWIDMSFDEEALLLLLADAIRAATYHDSTYILDLKSGRPVPIGPGRLVITKQLPKK